MGVDGTGLDRACQFYKNCALRNKEIARELHLSLGTVKMYLHHIYEKLRLGGRTQS